MDDYDRWVCEREDEREANRFDATPHFDSAGEAMRTQLEVVATERVQPPVGSYAATARMMASMFPDFDWDAWKDEMKEAS